MTVQEPKMTEADYGWLPKDAEWRRAYIAYREMRAAMSPEEEKAYMEAADEETIREMAELKRRAAERRRAEAAAGVASVYAAESHG